jgi:NAD(P)-dependent dehydrogenase (short-subunit alcohol dehydrogenase family)
MSRADASPILDRFRLDDRVAVVTGASSGLGLELALGLAQAGADLALGARRAERLAVAAKRVAGLGRRAVPVAMDVALPEDCERLVATAVERLGRVDVLVNCAGISDATPALKQSDDEFRRVVEVNLHGAFWMARACARVMAPGSSIVNISSALALTAGDVPSAGYASSKAGVIGLTRDLAAQWGGRRGIRVNALAPGFFPTELTQPLFDHEQLRDSALRRIPLGRFGEASELSGAVLFLASDAGSYVTGITLPVDGGWTMP